MGMDEVRMAKIKGYKKVFADTQIVTTHMLKKCAKIERIHV